MIYFSTTDIDVCVNFCMCVPCKSPIAIVKKIEILFKHTTSKSYVKICFRLLVIGVNSFNIWGSNVCKTFQIKASTISVEVARKMEVVIDTINHMTVLLI